MSRFGHTSSKTGERRVSHVHRFRNACFPYTHTKPFKKDIWVFMYRPNIPDQALGLSTALLDFTVETKRSTVGLTDGYKNRPVPKQLVGPGPIPPNLSPTYTNTGRSLSRPRSAIKHGKIRTGPQASLRLGRLYQFDLKEGKVGPTLDWWQTLTTKSENY